MEMTMMMTVFSLQKAKEVEIHYFLCKSDLLLRGEFKEASQ